MGSNRRTSGDLLVDHDAARSSSLAGLVVACHARSTWSRQAGLEHTSVVSYSVLHGDKQLIASKCKRVLPSEGELRAELEKEQLWLAE